MPANIKLIEARLDKAKAILNIYYKKKKKRNTIYYKQKEKLEVFATVTSKFQVLLFVI